MTSYQVLAFHKDHPEEVDVYYEESELPEFTRESLKDVLEKIYPHNWHDAHLSQLTIKQDIMILTLGGYIYMVTRSCQN